MAAPAFDATEHSHRRLNILTRQYSLVSPHRTKRPWLGQSDPPDLSEKPDYDPKCYLCPGNARAGGEKKTPKYESTYIFENDFAAVLPDEIAQPADDATSELFQTQAVRGNCFVICFSPLHRLTLAEMDVKSIVAVIEAWQKLYTDVSKEPWARYIQMCAQSYKSDIHLRRHSFENKGAMMGCSNPHPHGQSWCLSYVPSLSQTILDSQKQYALNKSPQHVKKPAVLHGTPCLLLDYVQAELARPDQPRILYKGEHFVSLVPYWALWPFETMIMPYKRRISDIVDLSMEEKADLAEALRSTTCRYDNLFECSFPYSMGLYQSPVLDDSAASYTQLHFCFYPPLLRSASVRKFIAGFELFAEAARDITPEQAAQRLRDCDAQTHYKQKSARTPESTHGAQTASA